MTRIRRVAAAAIAAAGTAVPDVGKGSSATGRAVRFAGGTPPPCRVAGRTWRGGRSGPLRPATTRLRRAPGRRNWKTCWPMSAKSEADRRGAGAVGGSTEAPAEQVEGGLRCPVCRARPAARTTCRRCGVDSRDLGWFKPPLQRAASSVSFRPAWANRQPATGNGRPATISGLDDCRLPVAGGLSPVVVSGRGQGDRRTWNGSRDVAGSATSSLRRTDLGRVACSRLQPERALPVPVASHRLEAGGQVDPRGGSRLY